MFSNLKTGDKVYVGYGARGIDGYHYREYTIKNITPKNKWISVALEHFNPVDGTCIDSNSSVHLELATPEFKEELRRKEYVKHTKFKLLDLQNLTYDQAIKINELLDTFLEDNDYEY